MIRSYKHLEQWRALLEDEIPRELGYYAARVAAGSATPAWHAQAQRQCASWSARITAILADADLALFQARNSIWTTAEIGAVVSALAAISSAIPSGAAAALAAHLEVSAADPQ